MNTNEIVKALRCYTARNTTNVCRTCPCYGVGDCFSVATTQAADTIEQLQKELEVAKRDMKCIVDVVREKHCDESCCFACKYDCDTSITESGDYAEECPGFDRDDCFEWRGVCANDDKEKTND